MSLVDKVPCDAHAVNSDETNKPRIKCFINPPMDLLLINTKGYEICDKNW